MREKGREGKSVGETGREERPVGKETELEWLWRKRHSVYSQETKSKGKDQGVTGEWVAPRCSSEGKGTTGLKRTGRTLLINQT